MTPPRLVDDPAGWTRPRARLVGRAAAVGVAVGLVALLGLPAALPARQVRVTAFALGALALGFGVLGWAASAMAGPGIENAQRLVDADTGWTERRSRRAMARVAGFGAGVMAAVPLTAPL